ncbi:hypothetical protein MUN81_05440 [Hymenobacter sp. 5317J-9]|uniref:hypothetical protein n=1 Tax=Hymenobacter sp. 5317J-9 TaxID=2932250 RepID=UPI001FD6D597|nr:hypothetical protein [Hymenobacter sp. 5317J-9]UOQ98934.1 hypothetical protein MUN81_05440 [Hymenobacter sp. 5317J-9]
MEVLVHLVFTVVKISVLASVYAALLLQVARFVRTVDPASPFARASTRPKRFWWRYGFLISVGLFLYSLTYWGNHGLGDYARIPLGHGEAMEEINGTMAYFEPVRAIDQSEVVAYQLADDVLCAQADDNLFYTYDLGSNLRQTFPDSTVYNAYAAGHQLPLSRQLRPFSAHYAQYWGGWRFWLLA